MPSKIRIAIADDHTLFRKSLAQLLEDDLFIVKIMADNGKDLIEKLTSNSDVRVVLMDINMPVMNGFDTTEYLRKHFPDIKILALTMSDADKDIIRMIKCGAHGYLLKDCEPIILKQAIRNVAYKGFHHSDFVSDKLANSMVEEEEKIKEVQLAQQLLSHELEYIRLACKDLTHREIANLMELSPRTIDGYRDHVFAKLGVQSRVSLILFAVKHRIFVIE